MELKENLVTEEVIETAEEVVVKASKSSIAKKATGLGLLVLAGVAAYKYVVKPLIAKNKANDEDGDETEKVDDIPDADFEEVDESEE